MAGNDKVQAAVVLWNGGPEALKELVEALAAWYSGVGAAGDDAGVEGEDVGDENDENDENDEGDEGAADAGDGEGGGDEGGETARRARMPKPTAEEIDEWTERAAAGESISSIARSCGRSISQVHRAVRKGHE